MCKLSLNALVIFNRIYTHDDKVNGRSLSGEKRGVCSCGEGFACEPDNKQYNTLIPWSLVHSATKKGQCSGRYGRLDWDSYFPTTITYPHPFGLQVCSIF